jgi:hypothetical protein
MAGPQPLTGGARYTASGQKLGRQRPNSLLKIGKCRIKETRCQKRFLGKIGAADVSDVGRS